jgi:biotin synthesis protein BioG
MQAQWVKREGNSRLVVFFNGCGMDARVTVHAAPPPDWDMLMLSNYRDLQVPAEAIECLDSGATVILAAWSMGVWAAGTLAAKSGRFAGSVAVNGTSTPIHDLHGIPPLVYHATVTGFSEDTRRSFYRRMCGRQDDLRRFMEHAPARELADQRAELAAIETLATAKPALPPFPFKSAVVGTQDRIIPASNLQRYWEQHGGCRAIEMPHFPFFHLSWKELIAHATGN